MLTFTGRDGKTITIDLEHRAEPMHEQGSIIMSTQVVLEMPLRVQAMITPDGRIVTRAYQWTGSANTYWHVDSITIDDVKKGYLTLTDAQCATIWQLWAGTHPYRKQHGNGVGATLQALTGQTLQEASKKYLNNKIPALA